MTKNDVPAGISHDKGIERQKRSHARGPVLSCGLPGDGGFIGQFGFVCGQGFIYRQKFRSGMPKKFPDGSFLAGAEAGGDISKGAQQRAGKTARFEPRAHFVNHGVAHKGQRCFPGSGRTARHARMETAGIRPQGQVKNMLEAHFTQAADIVGIPGEQGCPGTDQLVVQVQDKMGVIHKPGCQGKLQTFQQLHEHAFPVYAQMVQGQDTVGMKGDHRFEQALHKFRAGHFPVVQGQQSMFDAQALAGFDKLSHKKILAGNEQQTGSGIDETRPYGPRPEIKTCAGGELLAQPVVKGAIQPHVERMRYGKKRQTAVAVLPGRQLSQDLPGGIVRDPEYAGRIFRGQAPRNISPA